MLLLLCLLRISRTATAFCLARYRDLDTSTGTWPPRGAWACTERTAWLPHGNHYAIASVCAFCRAVTANTRRTMVTR